MDKLFLFACFLLPFENFFFAPSAGWATLTPIIFVGYLLCNIKYWGKCIFKYKKIFLMVFLGVIITVINLLFIDEYIKPAILRVISAAISLGLGLVSLMSFHIYLIEKNGDIKKIEKIILIAYSISLLVGLVQWISVEFNISVIKELAGILSKRNYLRYNRIQFCFTEPSFIGMHLYGVLLPIYMFGKNKKIKNLIIVFVLSSIFFGSSVRFLTDTAVVLAIYALYRINFKKAISIMAVAGVIFVMVFGGIYMYNNNGRVNAIINGGLYSDGSLASRWFRINATIKGYISEPFHTLMGYGLGQEVFPLKNGYNSAVAEYKSWYTGEVNALYYALETSEESVTFCLYTRLISEFGLIIFLRILMELSYIYKNINDKNWKFTFSVVLYLYIQFEPYAFYSIWLFLVLNEAKKRNQELKEL